MLNFRNLKVGDQVFFADGYLSNHKHVIDYKNDFMLKVKSYTKSDKPYYSDFDINLKYCGNNKLFHNTKIINMARYIDKPKPTPTAPDLLAKAADHMLERAKTYDKPEGERSMGKTVQAFNSVTGRDLTESEGWLLLQILKDVRLFQNKGYHADSAEDCIAYAALKAESKSKEC